VSLHSPELGAMAPLRVMEDTSQCPSGLPLRSIWRNGPKMASHISLVKRIVYAIDRRVRGAPRNALEAADQTQHGAMTFQQACLDLEDAAKQMEAGRQAGSMSRMARVVVPSLQEFSPEEYEQYAAEAGIPLYSSSPADPSAAPSPGRAAALIVAAAADMAAGQPPATGMLDTTSTDHNGRASSGISPLLARRLPFVSPAGMYTTATCQRSPGVLQVCLVHAAYSHICVISLDITDLSTPRFFLQMYDEEDAMKACEEMVERDRMAAALQVQAAQEHVQHQQVRMHCSGHRTEAVSRVAWHTLLPDALLANDGIDQTLVHATIHLDCPHVAMCTHV
jgi:hypothetical protein